MLTTCTACGTQFRVSTAQLRSVHGLVRCSRCHSVFDAFETLREEFEAPLEAPAAPTDALAALDEEISARKSENPAIPAQVAVRPADDDLFAAVWGESPGVTPAETIPEPAKPDTPVLIEDHIPIPPDLARDQALYKHVELPPRERHVPKSNRPRPLTVNAWGVGMVVLVLLLAVQVVNANRLELSHGPVLGPSLSAVYSALGHPLKPAASLGTWLVRNINVTSDPDLPGALSISGTLQNSASFAQAWPLLRVELADRDGDPLRARDFIASEYLPVNQTTTWLGAGMATRFRIDVVDPGPEAVGFQIQTCMEASGMRQCSSSLASD